jgi:hypothetical protein
MHVDNLFGAKDFARKAGDAMLSKFDHREEFCRQQAGLETSRRRHRFHMDHVSRANFVANPATGASFKVDTFDHAVPSLATRVAAINAAISCAHQAAPSCRSSYRAASM